MSESIAVGDTVSTSAPAVPKVVMIVSVIQLAASALLLVLLFLEWVPIDNLGLEGNGGGGFGILTLVTALVTIYAAVQGLRGHRRPTRIVGPNQLAAAFAVALFASNLVFLWVFRTGGAPKWVYIGANILIYVSVVALFAPQPEQAERLDDRTARLHGAIMAVLGIAIALAPMLPYTDLGTRTVTGYEPGAPRLGVFFVIVGAVTVFLGAQRAVRGLDFDDIGPYVSWPHVMLGLGIIATAPAFAWMISGLWGNDFDPGIGVYVSLVFGLCLCGLGGSEAARRGSAGI